MMLGCKLNVNFTLDEAIKIANEVVYSRFKRNLTDVEIIILRGAWEREDYDAIAAKSQYATSYISQDVAPKLWRYLTEALHEKVRKSNFKEALKRQWGKNAYSESTSAFSDNNTDILSSFSSSDKHNIESTNSSSFSCNPGKALNITIYIERPPTEDICYEAIKQPGALLRIKAPSLMGKTYLIEKIMSRASGLDYCKTSLSFELADRQTHFNSLNKFLRWFCINLGRSLGLPNEIDEYWDEEGMGAKVSCTTYFEEYLLSETQNPLLLCLDDVDLLFPYPHIYEDFFGLLRSWYEKARSRKIWQRLRLVISHSTDVYIRLNINQSPFNVGLPIELSEFNQEQVLELVRQHDLKLEDNDIKLLIELVGGHPYLLEQAFIYLKTHPQVTISELLTQAITDAGIYSHHLREHWLNLLSEPELVTALQTAIASNHPVKLEPVLAYKLQSIGLVKFSGNMLEPRCNLYREYFKFRFDNENQ